LMLGKTTLDQSRREKASFTPSARNNAPRQRFTQRPTRAVTSRRRASAEADHATNTFQAVPLMLNTTPSRGKAGIFVVLPASMNCGTKARKKSATLGFNTLVKNPCQKT